MITRCDKPRMDAAWPIAHVGLVYRYWVLIATSAYDQVKVARLCPSPASV